MSLDPALLVLIDGDRDALRLIAAWPVAGRPVDDVAALVRDADAFAAAIASGASAEFEPGSPPARWVRASGVDVERMVHLVPLLFENGMLGPNGTVEDSVHKLVQAAGVRGLRGGR